MTGNLNVYRKFKNIIYVLPLLLFYTCKTPYTPAPISSISNFLVVEGLINISDSTYITLSRTVNISAPSTVKPELKAVVTIENTTGTSYPLKETTNGVYVAAPLNLSAANQYRLRIKSTNGETYLSDFTDTKVTPPIDSVGWKPTNTDLQFYVNTHDAANKTRYYRWDYTETWEFKTNYRSFYVSDGLKITFRTPAQQVWDCFSYIPSHEITLGTSAQLTNDVIYQQVVNSIPSDQEKLGIKYTILVKQYALTKDAYDYWTLLKKNTQELGSVFDSQPSTSIGNIHSLTKPEEPVIGFISVGTVTSRRIYLSKSQLPSNWVTTPAYTNCPDPVPILPAPDKDGHPWQNQYLNWKAPEYVGTLYIPLEGDPQSGWNAVPPYCADCTLRGRNTPPSYWK